MQPPIMPIFILLDDYRHIINRNLSIITDLEASGLNLNNNDMLLQILRPLIGLDIFQQNALPPSLHIFTFFNNVQECSQQLSSLLL